MPALAVVSAVGCTSSPSTLGSSDDCLSTDEGFASLSINPLSEADTRLRDPARQDNATIEARVMRVVVAHALSQRRQASTSTKTFAYTRRRMYGVTARVTEFENLIRLANDSSAMRGKQARLFANGFMQQMADTIATAAAVQEPNDIALDTTLSTEQRAELYPMWWTVAYPT